MFGTFIGSTSGYRFYTISDSTKRYYVDDSTMFSRKDLFRLFGGLFKISTGKTNAEPRCLTSLDGHDGAICAAKHLELVHAHHLSNPYTDLTNSIWGKKY